VKGERTCIFHHGVEGKTVALHEYWVPDIKDCSITR